ncbi:MAG: sigma-54-dependent Fis family transcriptional regulator [candidate division NC10 bacterium]|nr:sigma-54-dependent Fis family transcriptional regulator [candidate division NC10 bacterium]
MGEAIKILVVDNDQEMVDLLMEYLSREGYAVIAAKSGQEALGRLSEVPFDMVVSDLKMEGIDGMGVLKAVKRVCPETPVILITAFGTIESAIEAIKEGAFHYLTKPFKLGELKVTIERALEHKRLREENVRLRREVEGRYRFGNIIGRSRRMQELFELIPAVAASVSNVLITGESGTGKELIAKAIHYNSPRKERPFLPINCAALPEQLLESELFGHVKGAFTGAYVSRKGLIEEAEGGTLFLDEVGDLSLSLQAKLLRVLQEKEVRPVGGRESVKVDVRFIAATNRDLRRMIGEGTFRDDLYYRLAVIPVPVPPLRERLEDLPLLVDRFLKKYAEASGKAAPEISQAALGLLLKQPWRGNVRELENVVEAAVALSKGPIINASELTPFLLAAVEKPSEELLVTLRELERGYIAKVLEMTGGNKKEAAKILGISRKTLYRKLLSPIDPPGFKR